MFWAALTWSDGFLPAFVLTCVIELPAYLLGWTSLGWVARTRAAAVPGASSAQGPIPLLGPLPAVGLALLVNLITHPVLWVTAEAWPEAVLALELSVVGVEGAIVAAVIRRRVTGRPAAAAPGWAWPVALGANALSVLAGSTVLRMLIG